MSSGDPMEALRRALSERPALAILRGGFDWLEVETIATLLAEHGFKAIEFTWNSPNPARTIEELQNAFGSRLLVGAGTILSKESAQEALDAGARFLVSPHWSTEVSNFAKENQLPYLPGVLTPTEVAAASSNGWGLLKLFPGGTGGPAHLRALRGPFNNIDFVVTGGVSATNARAYLDAGAFAVSMGSSVFRPGATQKELTVALRQMADSIQERTDQA